MRSRGFAILPALPHLPAPHVAALRDGLLDPAAKRKAIVPYPYNPATLVWRVPGILGNIPGGEGVLPRTLGKSAQAVIVAVTTALRQALPEEDLQLEGGTELRLADGAPSAGDDIHTDGSGYLAAVLALNGTGTVIYELKDNAVFVHPSPEGALAVLTNPTRQTRANSPSTVHSAPPLAQSNRLVLLMRFHARLAPAEQSPYGSKEYEAAKRENDKRARRIRRLLRP